MEKMLEKGKILLCPHCGADQEDVVEDFVIPNRIGISSASESQCWSCDKYFTVVCTEENKYKVIF